MSLGNQPLVMDRNFYIIAETSFANIEITVNSVARICELRSYYCVLESLTQTIKIEGIGNELLGH